ncbi:MAG: hybrid sensor histidine kinase/response regulator, partial [Gammaproteobacteria bacterium]
ILDLESEELGELPEYLLENKDLEDLEDLKIGDLPENLELESLELPEALEQESVGLSEFEFETTSIDEISYQTIDLSDEDTELTGDDFETIDPQLFEIFKTEASEYISELKKTFNNKNLILHIEQEVVRAFHTLNGSSRSVNFLLIAEIAAPMEKYARLLLEQQVELTPSILVFFNDAILLIENFINGKVVDKEQKNTLLAQIEISLKSLPSKSSEKIPSIENKHVEKEVKEEFDETQGIDSTDEFIALFFEEADEILENTQSLLERWTASPKNMQLMKELQRELHTLKGGARMVGIAPMGELSHHLESVLTRIVEGTAQSSPKLQEIVQNSVDELAAMLAAIRSSVPLDMPEDLIRQINTALADDDDEHVEESLKKPATLSTAVDVESQKTSHQKSKPSQIEKEVESVEGAEDRIRVKAALIDKLTNLAGELSISRAHMEQQQGSIKSNLVEMEQTVMRLRDQLRRFEIETEAQIISHFGGTKPESDEEFDPLELDRFSVMQQLSRSLMESVNDLTNIQDFIKNLTRQSDSLLIQQSRIGAELQEGIMRTRMVPFTRVSPRLQRIARLTARELHKQIEFVINGEELEFERTVLNRVVAPLEHMLRNAIDHGAEDAKTRQQAGKPAISKITVSLFREGAELIIKLSDDGAGLNMQKIRKKAEERGLIKSNTVINDDELIGFILEHGFSTADRLTQTSGRGVGMDVAYSEIKQLSGSLRIYSKTGEGTTFEIRLPLSLMITQALLVHIGEETMAVPMNHVDAVMRISRASVIGKAKEVRYYKYMDHSYRVFHLGELLGFSQVASKNHLLVPMLLIHAADRRMALLVDGIEGSKEIVVKSVGTQIGTIRWLAGATILGDGRVVLILDLPTLIRIDTIPESIDQPLEVLEEEIPAAKTIMIVDDSITVRKVTARFLKRQGMEVLTAKDGLDAIAKLQEHIPDLMLLDVEMPRMDGYELATQIRNRSDLKHLPIIMITSRTGTKHRDKAKKIGINRYLGKPFNESELLENIRALLAETMTNQSH